MENDAKYRWAFETKKYLMCITNRWLRGMFAKFRLRAWGLKSHKQWFTTEQQGDHTCPMYGQKRKDEIRFVIQLSDLRKNYSII